MIAVLVVLITMLLEDTHVSAIPVLFTVFNAANNALFKYVVEYFPAEICLTHLVDPILNYILLFRAVSMVYQMTGIEVSSM